MQYRIRFYATQTLPHATVPRLIGVLPMRSNLDAVRQIAKASRRQIGREPDAFEIVSESGDVVEKWIRIREQWTRTDVAPKSAQITEQSLSSARRR